MELNMAKERMIAKIAGTEGSQSKRKEDKKEIQDLIDGQNGGLETWD
jgi:hypothetical protein